MGFAPASFLLAAEFFCPDLHAAVEEQAEKAPGAPYSQPEKLDKSKNRKDLPHDYVQLPTAVKARYLKPANLGVPGGNFAVSDFRIFGNSYGTPPVAVSGFQIERDKNDPCNLTQRWQSIPDAYACEIQYGVAADKLYSSFLVYKNSEAMQISYDVHWLNRDTNYYFRIRAFSESGLSSFSNLLLAKSEN